MAIIPRYYSQGHDLPGNPAATRMTTSMQEALSTARQCLERARRRATLNADKHRRDEQYQPGDMVLLSTRNIKFRGKKTSKLIPKYIGPFKIINKVGLVAYKLQLPDKYHLHPTFHVALLRRYQTDLTRITASQPEEELDGEDYFMVERILDHQDRKKPGHSRVTRRYFLIRWDGYPPSEGVTVLPKPAGRSMTRWPCPGAPRWELATRPTCSWNTGYSLSTSLEKRLELDPDY
jgi:hypothetical protein